MGKGKIFLCFPKMCILFPFSKKDLGNVCQDIWFSAGNNLKIGKEIIINSGTKSKPLITLTQQGKAKVQRDIFVKFKGEVFEGLSHKTPRALLMLCLFLH